jgi:thioredoxin reductase (NADPH)
VTGLPADDYHAHAARQFAAAKRTIAEHVTSAYSGVCEACGRPGPCDELRAAVHRAVRYRPRPTPTPTAVTDLAATLDDLRTVWTRVVTAVDRAASGLHGVDRAGQRTAVLHRAAVDAWQALGEVYLGLQQAQRLPDAPGASVAGVLAGLRAARADVADAAALATAVRQRLTVAADRLTRTGSAAGLVAARRSTAAIARLDLVCARLAVGGLALDRYAAALTHAAGPPPPAPPAPPPPPAAPADAVVAGARVACGRPGSAGNPLVGRWAAAVRGALMGAMPNPVIVTIDAAPAVSGAVARDIRRRYGDRYRVVRAGSGPEALDALREIKLRGEQVAVLLADHRMPEMTGIEFLEAAMDLFPAARRVLLTAYADTSAAIDAINVVDLDHYLLKPWHPPEEKLYPVVDALLEAWSASPEAATAEVRVVGHRWSAPSFAVRDFLARNLVPYRWLPVDDPEAGRLLAAAGVGADQVPLVVTPEGKTVVAPSEAELAALVGLTVTPAADFYDLVVVGGGPAGLGAAVYGASEGLRTVLVERRATGGQAGQSSRIENYLGFPDGVSGAQLTDRARRQALKFGAELLSTREVVGLEAAGTTRLLRFADGSAVAAHTVVLATGVAYRTLDAPGLAGLTGRGVFYGSTATEAPSCAGQDVYIVGGANSAGQAAVHFSRYAARVHLLVRRADLTATMSRYLIDQVARIDTITVHPYTEVAGGAGDERLRRLTLRDVCDGVEREVDASWLFVFIGAEPRTEWLDPVVVRDARGFVVTGPDLVTGGRRPPGWTLQRDPYHLETSLPGVFAAGDVRAESVKRVASAVGEGAMAVSLVHRYLEAQ